MEERDQSIWREDYTEMGQKTEEITEGTAIPAVSGKTVQGTPGQYALVKGNAPEETESTKRLRENYGFIAPMTLGYGFFYALCMHRNGSGVTFPLFVGGSILFFCFVLNRLGISEKGLKKGSWFYLAGMMLLGISTFCTDDGILIFFNKLGAFLLLMSLLLKQFFDTSKWKLGKYLGSICIMTGASLGEWGRPFTDRAAYNKSRNKKTDKRMGYVMLGLLAGIPLLLVVVMLLASADAVFCQMTDKLLRSVNLANIFGVTFRILLIFFGSYGLTAYLCKKQIREEVKDRRRGEPILAITVTGLLTVLYLFFSVIQIAGLFLGKLRLPEGYTYALYARQGFFQLLAVSLLNLIIVLGCMSLFRESKILKIVLTVMSICTFIMIASSFMRMIMYIRYYYLTYLRILVLWGLVLLAVLFAGVVISIFRESFPLFHYSAAAIAVLYLALSFAHPDYIIARVNVANAPHGEMLLQEEEAGESSEASGNGGEGFFLAQAPYHDYLYLLTLSGDAAPVLVPYLKELGYPMEAFRAEDAVDYGMTEGVWDFGNSRSERKGFGYYWMRKMQRKTEDFGIRTYNVSRHRVLTEFRRAAE